MSLALGSMKTAAKRDIHISSISLFEALLATVFALKKGIPPFFRP